jgi:perosamine synthetase
MIPLFKPSCSNLEIEMVTETLRSGWWGQGSVTAEFEQEFAQYTGSPVALAVNSGTAALELAARALGIEGETVIVPALTFISSALAMRHAGNNVLLADVDENTLTIDWDSVRWLIENRVPGTHHVAVVPVWYGGYVDTIPEDILDSCTVIEDCAHAAGSQNAGLQGDAAAWSFHAVKNLAAGDGGAITFSTNLEATTRKAMALRWCGIDRSTFERDSAKGYGWDYSVILDGEKAHMNDITASLALAQLRRLPELNSKRLKLAKRYAAELPGRMWLRAPYPSSASSNHLYVIRIDAELRDKFIDHMRSKEVSAGVHYKPLYHYDDIWNARTLPGSVSTTERVWKELVTLPLFPDMTEAEQDQVISSVKNF